MQHSLVKQGDTISSRDWTAMQHCTVSTSKSEGNPWRTFECAYTSLSVVWSTEHPGRTKELPCMLGGSLTGIGLAWEVQASLTAGGGVTWAQNWPPTHLCCETHIGHYTQGSQWPGHTKNSNNVFLLVFLMESMGFHWSIECLVGRKNRHIL